MLSLAVMAWPGCDVMSVRHQGEVNGDAAADGDGLEKGQLESGEVENCDKERDAGPPPPGQVDSSGPPPPAGRVDSSPTDESTTEPPLRQPAKSRVIRRRPGRRMNKTKVKVSPLCSRGEALQREGSHSGAREISSGTIFSGAEGVHSVDVESSRVREVYLVSGKPTFVEQRKAVDMRPAWGALKMVD